MSTQGRLTFEDISRLHDRQESIKRANSDYITEHPELKSLIADFTAAILMQKPDDVFQFARDHFSVFRTEADVQKTAAVYFGKHVIEDRRYEIVINKNADRSKWLQVTAQDISPGRQALHGTFSVSEIVARFNLSTIEN